MDNARKAIGAILLVIAAVVLVWYVFSTFFEDDTIFDVWRILDIFILGALIVAFLAHGKRKLAISGERRDAPIDREYVEANVLFYFTAILSLAFLWNWVDFLTLSEGESQGDTRALVWSLIDAATVILAGVTGLSLWRGSGER